MAHRVEWPVCDFRNAPDRVYLCMCVYAQIEGGEVADAIWRSCSVTLPCLGHEVGKAPGCWEVDQRCCCFKGSSLAAAKLSGDSALKWAIFPFVLTTLG